MKRCRHDRKLHLADNCSCSAGRIEWCPDCGAIAVERIWLFSQESCRHPTWDEREAANSERFAREATR